MAPLDLTKTELTPQESEDIRNEVARFEVLYQERYGALMPGGCPHGLGCAHKAN